MHQLSPKAENISIHALLAESDRLCTILYSCPGNFYPRSPCGERRLMGSRGTGLWNFYPRSPCGERHNAGPLPTVCRDFYPRSPCGERHIIPICMGVTAPISIHALLAESDNNINNSVSTADKISIHALLAESDIHICQIASRADYFYPRSPCGERLGTSTLPIEFTPISIHALLAESDPLYRA